VHIGHYISGAGHLSLIGWLLLGGVFRSEPPPLEMTEVSVITGAAFEAILAAQRPPDSATDVTQPEAPDATPDPPEVTATPDEAVPQPEPQQTEAPAEDAPPEVTEVTPPPEAEISDVPPELEQPIGDQAVLAPQTAPVAVPRPVDRVAPQTVVQPDPDATPSDVDEAAVAPDETGETTQVPKDAQAQPEAVEQIVTEATTAPRASSRPPGKRPTAPVRQAVETPTPEADPVENTAPTATADTSVEDALREALEGGADTGNAAAQGLNENELAAFKQRVGQKWQVDVGSLASTITIIVRIELTPAGTLASIPILLSSDSNDQGATNAAFRAARTALIAVSRDGGFALPAENYAEWKILELAFNPEEMGRL